MYRVISFCLCVLALCFCVESNARGVDVNLTAGKVVHDCNQERDMTLNLVCISYINGFRDGLMAGVMEDWSMSPNKALSADTIVRVMTKYLHDKPTEGDETGLVVAIRSLEKAEIIKRRSQFR